MGVKAAFSSNRLTRAPGVQHQFRDGVLRRLGFVCPATPIELPATGGGGNVLNVTRKNFAVAGAKEIVCSVVPSWGIGATTW